MYDLPSTTVPFDRAFCVIIFYYHIADAPVVDGFWIQAKIRWWRR